MRINLDDTLGELTFVRKLMPESALVFLNVSGSATLTPPVSGSVVHPYSALQPWLMFGTKNAPVCAPGAGTVSAVSELSGGQYGLLIDHGQGLESVCAGLSAVSVQSGAVRSSARAAKGCTLNCAAAARPSIPRKGWA